MKRMYAKYTDPDSQKLIAKIIRMQIRYLDRHWRKNHMSIVSIPYQLTQKSQDDDWLAYEGAQDDQAQKLHLQEFEIRDLMTDFNFFHYEQFCINGEEKQQPQVTNEPLFESEAKYKHQAIQKLWSKVTIDEEKFKSEYEQWLEDEVWTYFD